MENLKTKGVEGLEGLKADQILKLFIQVAVQNHYSYAIWRRPNDSKIHFVADCSGLEKIIKPDIHTLSPGFLVSPFLNKDNSKTTFIKADLYYLITDNTINSCPFVEGAQDLQTEDFERAVVSLHRKGVAKYAHYYSNGQITPSQKDDFISLVNLAIKQIDEGNFEKLVPSKVKIIDLPDNFNLIDCFYNLCKAYSNTLVSMIGTPSLGTWLGSSPEILVSMSKEGIFKTVALAGTQKAPESLSSPKDIIAQASWTQKEIEEQALVSRYIINCFKKIRLRKYEERGPKTILAGNVMHLKTDYSVDTKAMEFPELPSIMLELLHPTSAVSGMPREASLEFIQKNEKFERQLFSGYLGPINIDEASDIFVNLRCMQILDKQAAIYAGAGVTSCSNPEKEWMETELKCETLLNVIQK